MRRRRAGEQGQAVVITALAMVVICGMGAVAVDVSEWYAKRHSAQVAADAGALAAAQCLASSGSGQPCTSTTDTTDAAAAATTEAADNGINIPTSDVTFSNQTVSVQAPAPAPGYFAKVFGLGNVQVQANAAAKYSVATSWGATACTASMQTAHTCGAFFAGDPPCGTGVTIGSIAGTIYGGITSDGNLTIGSGAGTITGSLLYGPGCSESDTWAGSAPTPQQLTASVPYPEQWGGSTPNETTPTCTLTASSSSAGTFTYGAITIVVTSTNITISGAGTVPAGVYCAPNGTISIPSLAGSGQYLTLIAQTISLASGAGGLSPCTSAQNAACPATNPLLIWQTGTTSFNLSSGAGPFTGTVYVPNATIVVGSLAGSTGFVEGNTLNLNSAAGTFNGNGPAVTTGGTGGNTNEQLIQ